LRLEWRSGAESTAAELYRLLGTRPGWHAQASRAALFLAASDVVRGRSDRASAWLDRARAFGSKEDQPEVAYRRGRLAGRQGEAGAGRARARRRRRPPPSARAVGDRPPRRAAARARRGGRGPATRRLRAPRRPPRRLDPGGGAGGRRRRRLAPAPRGAGRRAR